MVRKFTLLLLLSLFSGYAQIIDFPDANFNAKLLEANPDNGIAVGTGSIAITIDINGDGEIEHAEANLVTELYLYNSNAESAVGILPFVNPRVLYLDGAMLTALDLHSLSDLTSVSCSSNVQLSERHVKCVGNMKLQFKI